MAPDEVAEFVRTAARRRDCSGNALAFGVLDWVENQFGAGPRLTGQNGEFARGFYYPGQPNWHAVNRPLISALGRWRIFTNDPVDPDLFATDLRKERRAWALEHLYESMPRHSGGWLSATDEYYLHERMRNWLGAEWSASSMDRPVLAPFFHPDYLAWARSCPPAQKRSSRIFCRVLGTLDERLAAIPSTAGASPQVLGQAGSRSTIRRSAALGRKVVAKSRQRINRQGKPATGAGDVAGTIRQVWSKNPAALDAVSALDFLDRKTVVDIVTGQRTASPATVSFLLDLSIMLELIDH
jgi:asparagine synthase (glutamine-hydrolysing)